MQEKLSSKLKINKDKIEIIPFYEINDIDYTHKDFNEKIISFFCVTSSSRHKNLKRLIKAFKKIGSPSFQKNLSKTKSYYGKPGASKKIYNLIEKKISKISSSKKFVDII